MGLTLYEVKQHGRQIQSGKIQLTSTAIDGVSVAAGISKFFPQDIENKEVWLKVVYRDGDFNAESRETSLWTWNQSDNTINRVANSTFSSSNGGSAVEWSPNIDVTVYSVSPPNSVITIQDILTSTGTDYSISFTGALFPSSDWVTVTPKSNLSVLDITVVSDLRVIGLNSSNNARGSSRFRYRGASTDIDFGQSVFAGYINQNTPDNSPQEYEPLNMFSRLDQTSLNANGDWQIRTVSGIDFAGTQLNTFNQLWSLREKIL